MDYSQYSLAKTGYLKEDFRLFHINDRTDREFEWHYHDFHKIIVFVSGKVTYHIEGKAYHLKPQDILLVSQGASGAQHLLPESQRPQFQSRPSGFCPPGTSQGPAARDRAVPAW